MAVAHSGDGSSMILGPRSIARRYRALNLGIGATAKGRVRIGGFGCQRARKPTWENRRHHARCAQSLALHLRTADKGIVRRSGNDVLSALPAWRLFKRPD